MNFDEALEVSTRKYHAVERWRAAKPHIVVGSLGLGLMALLVVSSIEWYLALAIALGATVLSYLMSLFRPWTSPPAAPPFEKFKTRAPELWVPSPSHGLLLVDGDWVMAGATWAPLDRHANDRVTSVSYDEAGHALILQTVRAEWRDGNKVAEQHSRAVVALEAAYTAEQARALARTLGERAAR